MYKLELNPGQMTLQQLRQVAAKPVALSLASSCHERIEQSVTTVKEVVDQGRVIYGINTGFGLMANTVIPNQELEQLQRSIVLSHAAGTGHSGSFE